MINRETSTPASNRWQALQLQIANRQISNLHIFHLAATDACGWPRRSAVISTWRVSLVRVSVKKA